MDYFDEFEQEKTILKEVDELTMWGMLEDTAIENDFDWSSLDAD